MGGFWPAEMPPFQFFHSLFSFFFLCVRRAKNFLLQPPSVHGRAEIPQFNSRRCLLLFSLAFWQVFFRISLLPSTMGGGGGGGGRNSLQRARKENHIQRPEGGARGGGRRKQGPLSLSPSLSLSFSPFRPPPPEMKNFL